MPTVVVDVFHGFPQSCQAGVGIICKTRPQLPGGGLL
jgi:hypothetical protein